MDDVLYLRLPPRLFPLYALVRPFRLATGYVAPSRSRRTTDLGPWLQSPQAAVERMLELAQVTSKDVVYDLGCGNGRIVLEAAATRGARGVGVDIAADLIEAGRDTARRLGVDHLVSFALRDAMETDLSPATVVVLYLPPASVLRLRAKLESELRPGARVVAHEIDIPGWIPARTELVATKHGVTSVCLWSIAGGGAQPDQKHLGTLPGVAR
jgi:SAM-dependent methyltransferase